MQSLGLNVPTFALFIGVCASSLLASCGNSCFVGYSVNGNGGVIVKGGNPPPVCTLNQAQGMVRAAMLTTAMCESCAPVAQAQHMYVRLRGIQIRSGDGYGDADGWVDIAPQLAAKPRTIDLVGDSLPELDIATASVPAGTYDQLRVQFSSTEQSREAGSEASPNCSANCLVTGDGRTEALRFAADAPEVLIGLTAASKPLLILPNGRLELKVRLSAQSSLRYADGDSRKPQVVLLGEATMRRESAGH